MTGRRSARLLGALCAAALIAGGCATTKVRETRELLEGAFPRPDEVLVYDFSVSKHDVTLDHSVVERAVADLEDADQNETQLQVGRAVADALSETMVEQIQKLGLSARRARGAPPAGNVALVHGHFLDVDEGSETTRLVVGFGAGSSNVKTRGSLYVMVDERPDLIEQFDTDAESMIKPGMLESMGAGALGGRLGVSAAVSVGGGAASEEWKDNVDAEAKRTGKEVVKHLAKLFVDQGWVTQAVVDETMKGFHIP